MLPLHQFHFVAVAEGDGKFRVFYLLVMNVDSEWANVELAIVNGLVDKRDKASFGIPL